MSARDPPNLRRCVEWSYIKIVNSCIYVCNVMTLVVAKTTTNVIAGGFYMLKV